MLLYDGCPDLHWSVLNKFLPTDSVPVTDYNCAFQAPGHTRSCHVPCPQDCGVSHWAPWSKCLPDRCRLDRNKGKSGYRTRTRVILGEGVDGGMSCPHLKEIQPCEYPACYHWQSTTVGDCQLKYPDMQCGEGLMNRTALCASMQEVRTANSLPVAGLCVYYNGPPWCIKSTLL